MNALFPAASRLALVCALGSGLVPARSQAQETPPPASAPASTPAPTAPVAKPDPTVSQDAEALVVAPPAPSTKPLFALGSETYFISPVLSLAGGFHSEQLLVNPSPGKEGRLTTVAISRFGVEGRLGPYVTFRTEFERNLRAHGSGIWEGTASLSSRDQIIRLQRWGATLEAGIVLDPASVDFFSAHMGDLLIADKYTRDPLLYSGFNRGQGVQARYTRWGFTAGLNYSEANPLSSSASFMVGGSFAGNNRFWERPLSNFRNGQPDDDVHFRVITPSLTYEHRAFEVRAAAQFLQVNYQTTSMEDPPLLGRNLRGGVLFKLKGLVPSLPVDVRPFANVAHVQNDVLNSAAGYGNQLLTTPFDALSVSGGLDVLLFGRSGVGFHYASVMDHTPYFVPPSGSTPASEPVLATRRTYLNVGGTWWLMDQVALGVRVATSSLDIEGRPELAERDRSVFATLRLIL